MLNIIFWFLTVFFSPFLYQLFAGLVFLLCPTYPTYFVWLINRLFLFLRFNILFELSLFPHFIFKIWNSLDAFFSIGWSFPLTFLFFFLSFYFEFYFSLAFLWWLDFLVKLYFYFLNYFIQLLSRLPPSFR